MKEIVDRRPSTATSRAAIRFESTTMMTMMCMMSVIGGDGGAQSNSVRVTERHILSPGRFRTAGEQFDPWRFAASHSIESRRTIVRNDRRRRRRGSGRRIQSWLDMAGRSCLLGIPIPARLIAMRTNAFHPSAAMMMMMIRVMMMVMLMVMIMMQKMPAEWLCRCG